MKDKKLEAITRGDYIGAMITLFVILITMGLLSQWLLTSASANMPLAILKAIGGMFSGGLCAASLVLIFVGISEFDNFWHDETYI